jgi:stage III sporulation protein AG
LWIERLKKAPMRLLALGALGIILLLAGSMMSAERNAQSPAPVSQGPTSETRVPDETLTLSWYQAKLAQEAERVIGQIRGSGRVVISITIAGTPENVLAGNTQVNTRRTEEKDQSGITRVTQEQTDSSQPVITRQSASGDRPVVTRTTAPKVEGVLVVSSGASDPRVRTEIFRAIQVLFNVPAHKVSVLPMKAGE